MCKNRYFRPKVHERMDEGADGLTYFCEKLVISASEYPVLVVLAFTLAYEVKAVLQQTNQVAQRSVSAS